MDKTITAVAVALAFVVGVSACTGRVYIAAAAFVLLLLSYMKAKKDTSLKKVDSDSLTLLRNISVNYAQGASSVSVLGRSIGQNLAFSGQLKLAIRRYLRSGDIESSFASIPMYDSYLFFETVSIMKAMLASQKNVRKRISNAVSFAERLEQQQLKLHGNMTNSISVARLGSVLFFPIFAGISYRIILFSGSLGLSSGIQASGLLPVVSFYIGVSNLIGSLFFSRGMGANSAAFSAALYSGAAFIVLAASSVAASIMLR
jgi:hypothetical protein